jgi:hypothetical protein
MLSGPGFQDLNARFQDLDLRTWVSGPQREVSGPGFQDLESSPSYGRLIFSRHFSLRPPSLFSASAVTFLCVQWSQPVIHYVYFCRAGTDDGSESCPPVLATVTASHSLRPFLPARPCSPPSQPVIHYVRFCRAGPGRPSVTDPSSVRDVVN